VLEQCRSESSDRVSLAQCVKDNLGHAIGGPEKHEKTKLPVEIERLQSKVRLFRWY
jgi:hypothetical protein